ncbi:MAG: hypothetical protein IKI97_13725 [Clostridia bacterium]|nr:hypothetical protein [Clostridia bacterium]
MRRKTKQEGVTYRADAIRPYEEIKNLFRGAGTELSRPTIHFTLNIML